MGTQGGHLWAQSDFLAGGSYLGAQGECLWASGSHSRLSLSLGCSERLLKGSGKLLWGSGRSPLTRGLKGGQSGLSEGQLGPLKCHLRASERLFRGLGRLFWGSGRLLKGSSKSLWDPEDNLGPQ